MRKSSFLHRPRRGAACGLRRRWQRQAESRRRCRRRLTHVTKTDFDELIAPGQGELKAQGQAFPKQGTTEVPDDQGQAVTLLVQQAERERRRKHGRHGHRQADRDAARPVKKQYFEGTRRSTSPSSRSRASPTRRSATTSSRSSISESVYKQDHQGRQGHRRRGHGILRDATQRLLAARVARRPLHPRARTRRSPSRSTSSSKGGTDADVVHARQEVLEGPERPRTTAARRRFTKGQTVPEFDTVAFSRQDEEGPRAGQRPTQYGWFVLQPLARDQARGDHAREERGADQAAAPAARSKNKAMTDWVEGSRRATAAARRSSTRRATSRARTPARRRRRPPRRPLGWRSPTRWSSSRSSPSGCAASARGTASRPRGRSCRTRSRRRTRSPTRRSPATTRSCSTSSATCSSSRTSWRCCCTSAAPATSRRSRAASTRSWSRATRTSSATSRRETAGRVRENWERLKVEQEGREGVFHDVPEALPALLLRAEGAARARRGRVRVPRLAGALADLDDELRELRAELRGRAGAGDRAGPRVAAELGDVLFAAVNVARQAERRPGARAARGGGAVPRRVEEAERARGGRRARTGRRCRSTSRTRTTTGQRRRA